MPTPVAVALVPLTGPGGAARWAAAALVVVGFLIVRRVGHRLVLRSRLRRVVGTTGAAPAQIDAAVRAAAPLLRRIRPRRRDLPRDPFALTFPVAFAASQGRPGVRFVLPSAPMGQEAEPPRIDTRCRLDHGAYLLVVCLGRVGADQDGLPLEPAEGRCAATRSRLVPGWASEGPVLELATAAGPAWRHAFATASARVVDTHVDRDGWAFVVGVLQRQSRRRLDGVADAVLASWRWER